jgi:hypothetical protein
MKFSLAGTAYRFGTGEVIADVPMYSPADCVHVPPLGLHAEFALTPLKSSTTHPLVASYTVRMTGSESVSSPSLAVKMTPSHAPA